MQSLDIVSETTIGQEPQELRRYVVLQPQWMINGITSIVFDEKETEHPEYGHKLNKLFGRFLSDRVINEELLSDIWRRKAYSAEVQMFFKTLMLKSNVMCEYSFSNKNEYLVPSLFSAGKYSNKFLEPNEFTGQYFVVDFSGAYNETIIEDTDFRYVRYLPFGLFERLICLCVQHSASFRHKLKPRIKRDWAILSFGNKFRYELRICQNQEHEPLWIKVTMDKHYEPPPAIQLVKLIYSMIKELKDIYFSSKNNVTVLAISLLIPSKDGILAEYELIRKERENHADEEFWPSSLYGFKAKPSDFDFWFEDKPNESLTQPNLAFEKQFEKDKGLLYLTVMPSRPLPDGLQYHCFLSYKQSSAIDIVGKQYYILSTRGFRCWYDMQFKGELTLEAMQEGVRNSMVYCLHLSKDIFPIERKPGVTYFVDEEVKMAVALKKPIMMFHHPDTDKKDYWSFGDYISHAPDELKSYFSKVESIQLQRRFYLEESTTEQIVLKLEKYLNESRHQ